MLKAKLKEAFDVESKHGAFYTGGNVEWHQNILFCQGASTVSFFNIDSGKVEAVIGETDEDADAINTFTVNNKNIVTSHRSGLFKLWNEDGILQKTWKNMHKGPVARLSLSGTVLASGGSDSSVRIWNMEHQACVLNLRGAQGVVHVVEFYPNKNEIIASGDDGKIQLWGLKKGELIRNFCGHFSKVTCINFHKNNKVFVSGGRDKVIILWDYKSEKYLKIIPVYETIESIVVLDGKFELPGFSCKSGEGGTYVATAGNLGVIRVWDFDTSKIIFTQTNSLVDKAKEEGGLSITKLLYNNKEGVFGVITAEQNILLYQSSDFNCVKQFVGFSDEILDIIYVGNNDEFMAVATNSCDVKLYENETMNCQLLKGHTDIVLALSSCTANRNLFASSAKDNSVNLWELQEKTATLLLTTKTHTASVSSVAFSQLSASFIATVGQDKCLKMWEIPQNRKDKSLMCLNAQNAHDKDINCVTISPNDKLVATASQDKTAKLWSLDLQCLGTLRGHKRGVFCVRFSPVDQVVLTTSADCTVKIWSILELNCLKTIEGHEASVLRAEFITNGLQIISAGADGLLKLFNLKTSECSLTLDQHDGRIWALAVKRDESGFVSGGADSLLIKWKDVTVERREEKKKLEEEMTLQEQQMRNYVNCGEYLKALSLALKLNRPSQTRNIIQAVLKEGDGNLKYTVEQLQDEYKELLLNTALEWNTNSRFCHEAQLVLNILLDEVVSGKLKMTGLNRFVESAIPYTEKHFKRLTQLLQDLYFIKYTVKCIEPHSKVS